MVCHSLWRGPVWSTEPRIFTLVLYRNTRSSALLSSVLFHVISLKTLTVTYSVDCLGAKGFRSQYEYPHKEWQTSDTGHPSSANVPSWSPQLHGSTFSLPIKGWAEEHGVAYCGILPDGLQDVLGIVTSVTFGPRDPSKPGQGSPANVVCNPASSTNTGPVHSADFHLLPLMWSLEWPGSPFACHTDALLNNLMRILLDMTVSPNRVPC